MLGLRAATNVLGTAVCELGIDPGRRFIYLQTALAWLILEQPITPTIHPSGASISPSQDGRRAIRCPERWNQCSPANAYGPALSVRCRPAFLAVPGSRAS